jgi:hypothetical protein
LNAFFRINKNAEVRVHDRVVCGLHEQIYLQIPVNASYFIAGLSDPIK